MKKYNAHFFNRIGWKTISFSIVVTSDGDDDYIELDETLNDLSRKLGITFNYLEPLNE